MQESSLRCPARGISCSGRRSHWQICRATGFHLSHVALLVVPAGPVEAEVFDERAEGRVMVAKASSTLAVIPLNRSRENFAYITEPPK